MRQAFEQKPREDLDARRMTQIKAVDLQAAAKLGVVRLPRVALHRVDRKACRDDQLRTRAQQLERGLKSDLHARAGDQCDASAQIGGLRALGVIEIAALAAHRVVVAVHPHEGALADVARAASFELRPLVRGALIGRWLEPQGGVDRCAPLDAKPGLLDGAQVVRLHGFPVGAPKCLRHPHQILTLGFCDQAGEHDKLAPRLARQMCQVGTVGFDRTQHAQAGVHVRIGRWGGGRVFDRFGILGGVHGSIVIEANCELSITVVMWLS